MAVVKKELDKNIKNLPDELIYIIRGFVGSYYPFIEELKNVKPKKYVVKHEHIGECLFMNEDFEYYLHHTTDNVHRNGIFLIFESKYYNSILNIDKLTNNNYNENRYKYFSMKYNKTYNIIQEINKINENDMLKKELAIILKNNNVKGRTKLLKDFPRNKEIVMNTLIKL